jgi:hypothetical protein
MRHANALAAQREHLANLLEAAQRCAHYMHASATKLTPPLEATRLHARRKDQALFESLAAFNERFAKLQHTLGAAMRHAALLMGEPTTPFLRVMALFEKLGVLTSIDDWQLCRAARNLAAHDYETDYASIAEHFNELLRLQPVLVGTAERLLGLCKETLGTGPASEDFAAEFRCVTVALAGKTAG